MDDEELNKLSAMATEAWQNPRLPDNKGLWASRFADYVPILIAEVRRLQAENSTLTRWASDADWNRAQKLLSEARADERAKCEREARFREENVRAGVRADERERCAKIAQELEPHIRVNSSCPSSIAAEIRALKDPP